MQTCTRAIIEKVDAYRKTHQLQTSILPHIDANYNNGCGEKDKEIYLSNTSLLFQKLSDTLTELTPRRHTKSGKPPKEADIIKAIANCIINYIDTNYSHQTQASSSYQITPRSTPSVRRSQSHTVFHIDPSPRPTSSTQLSPRSMY